MREVEPGCYGISICFDPLCDTCKTCPFRDTCVVAAKEEMENVGQIVSVLDLRRRFKETPTEKRVPQLETTKRVAKMDKTKSELSPLELAKVASMKKKPAETAKALFAMSIDIADHLKSGVNPFVPGKFEFLSVPFDLMVERTQFTKKELKRGFLSRFPHWTERTAEGRVSQTVSLLVSLGVVEKSGTTLRRKVCL